MEAIGACLHLAAEDVVRADAVLLEEGLHQRPELLLDAIEDLHVARFERVVSPMEAAERRQAPPVRRLLTCPSGQVHEGGRRFHCADEALIDSITDDTDAGAAQR